MSYSLIWLPDVLKSAGLKVAVEFGWENRGRGDVGPILGVICHHTGVQSAGNMPTLNSLIEGRAAEPGLPALSGPLAQLGLGRDGTYYVVGAGRCNHAGEGNWKGLTNGNANFIGIEAENTGRPSDAWPPVQMEAYYRGVAAILKQIGRGSDYCVGHKEWARERKVNKKSDPTFDMNAFRTSVAAVLNGLIGPPVLIPGAEPSSGPGTPPGRPTLRRDATGALVEQIQGKINATVDGNFGAKTEAHLRDFQRAHNLVPDGIVGPKTWASLDRVS